jgi:predicted NUDIX family NTP pyrophosphohydrolase
MFVFLGCKSYDFMSVLDLARVVIYRFHEKGLEIFLINNEMDKDQDIWQIPQGLSESIREKGNVKNIIDLDTTEDEQGRTIKTLAIEGDWHDIPSIRGMLKHDVKLVKAIVKENLPGSEKGAYFAVKEAFKKVLPHEYKALKELKDVLFDRNSVTNI